MGMKPTVPDDGSIQHQIGSAYDVVKSVADNLPLIIELKNQFDGFGSTYVPNTRTINGKALSTDVSLNAGDVGARVSSWVPAWAEITNKPTTLSGYGITDAQGLDATLTALSNTVTAANKLIYFTAADTTATTDISSFGRTLIDDADAAAARTTLGLGSAATFASTAFQAASTALSTFNTNIASVNVGVFKKTAANVWDFVALTDADIPNLNVSKLTAGTLPVVRGGTGRSDNKSAALITPVTITIGSSGKSFDGSAAVSWTLSELGAQAVNANLTSFSVLSGVADRVPYFTGPNTVALTTFTAFGRSIVAAVDATAVNTLLGVQTKAEADTIAELFNRATVDYDFVRAVYKEYKNKYITEIPLIDAVTCARNSAGTADHPFGIVTYDVNEPRIQYDPLTNERLGLLTEENRTNTLLHSESFDNVVWTKRGGSIITPNTTIAPDGTSFADTHTNTDTIQNGSYIRYVNAFTVDNTVYCGSFFTKRGSKPECRLVLYSRLASTSNVTVVYNFDTDFLGIVNSGSVVGAKAGVIKYPNGWVRVWASFDCLAGSEIAGFNIIPSNWGIPSAIGSEFGYVWGAQVEVGSFPTEYIPTGSISYFRAFDNYTIPSLPASLTKLSEYTIYIEYTVIDVNKGVLFGIGDSFSNTIYATVNTPAFFRSGGIGGPSCPTSTVIANTRYKHAIKVKSGDYAVVRNGEVIMTTNAVFPVPVSPTRAKLGSAPWEDISGVGNQSTIIFHRFVVIPRALTNAEMQLLTK